MVLTSYKLTVNRRTDWQINRETDVWTSWSWMLCSSWDWLWNEVLISVQKMHQMTHYLKTALFKVCIFTESWMSTQWHCRNTSWESLSYIMSWPDSSMLQTCSFSQINFDFRGVDLVTPSKPGWYHPLDLICMWLWTEVSAELINVI